MRSFLSIPQDDDDHLMTFNVLASGISHPGSLFHLRKSSEESGGIGTVLSLQSTSIISIRKVVNSKSPQELPEGKHWKVSSSVSHPLYCQVCKTGRLYDTELHVSSVIGCVYLLLSLQDRLLLKVSKIL